MNTMTKYRLLPIALAACALLLAGCQAEPAPADKPADTSASAPQDAQPSGKTAFTRFEAQTLAGAETDQTLFKDYKLTMINIWGTFCGPCLKEMPDLGELHREYADKGFQVVGIVTDAGDMNGNIDSATVEKAKKIVEQTGADYTHLLPSKDLIRNKLATVSSIPETVFVDEQGRQVGRAYTGAITKAEWASVIESLLEKVN